MCGTKWQNGLIYARALGQPALTSEKALNALPPPAQSPLLLMLWLAISTIDSGALTRVRAIPVEGIEQQVLSVLG